MRIITTLLVLLAALPALAQPAVSPIVPGVRIGPVTLGMAESDARAAALRFQRDTGCEIDLLIEQGAVAAAGTRFGGCLALQLPPDTQPLAVQAGPFLMPLPAGIGGPTAALLHAFGRPLRTRDMGGDRAAVIWPQGLAAHVADASDRGGIVTYLAIVTPGDTAIPRIGHFSQDTDLDR
jgi:hypothetical protein